MQALPSRRRGKPQRSACAVYATLVDVSGSPPARDELDGVSLRPFLTQPERLSFPTAPQQGTLDKTVAFSQYGPLNYRTAARTLFLRPYLAHFCSFFRHFFAVFSVLTPGFHVGG